MKNKQRSQAGFTLVEIMIVVAIIGMLAVMAIPNFVRARKNAQSNACINNLRQIDGAKHQWALEEGHGGSALPGGAELKPYIGRGNDGSVNSLYCPLIVPAAPLAGYNINQVAVPPACQNFDGTLHPAHID